MRELDEGTKMKTDIKKTVVIELTETEAFSIKTFIELGIKELKDVPEAYLNQARKLVDKFEEVDV